MERMDCCTNELFVEVKYDKEVADADQNILKTMTETSKECEITELDQICRGCLDTNNIGKMDETFVGGAVVTVLYQHISKINIENENMPAMLCASCVAEFKKINSFIETLQYSHEKLVKAFNDIEALTREENLNESTYESKKIEIIKNTLNLKNHDLKKKDSHSNNITETIPNNNVLSDISDNGQNLESSDDDIPLAEKFKIDLGELQSKKESKENKKGIFKKKPPPTRKPKKRKTSGNKLTNNKTELPVSELVNNSQDVELESNSEVVDLLDCPLCMIPVKSMENHLESVHSLDRKQSICLKCSYQDDETEKPIEHSRDCPRAKIEEKLKKNGSATQEKLKVEFESDNDDDDDIRDNPDFDLDEPREEPNRDILQESEFEEIEELQNTSPQRSAKKKRKDTGFTCNKCENVSYTQYKYIESHLKEVHGSESNCILCEKAYGNPFSLLYHMMVKHGKLKCCRLCLVSFKSSEELNKHYKSEEHNTKCTVCGEQFKNRKALYEHRRKKHLNPQLENQKYKCPVCSKEFANQNNTRRHILVAHNDLRFLCDTCGQSYTTKRNLKLHIQKFHEGVQIENKNTKKNFFCEACGKELKIFHKYAISMHIAKHKGHNYVCKKCYDSFKTEQEFKKHVEDFGHQLFSCDKCESEFVREEYFKAHLKNHDAPGWNKNMFATWGKSAKLRNEKGEFVCSYCPKVFKDKQRLDNHVRVHTNERPYKCHICTKGFKTWIHRKTHLNIHLGIKKWVCKYCAKAFTNSCTLKGHEMIHTGERPYRCSECKKGFITMSAMKKHRLIHFRNSNCPKKEKPEIEHDEKVSVEQEDHIELMFKYGQMFTGSDVSYESCSEPLKEPSVDTFPIEKELSC